MNPRLFLREKGYPLAVLTTYSFDPIFFERMILPDLWAGGSGSVMVFVDRRELQSALETVVGRLRHLGRRYFLVPVDAQGAFHPKIFLRLGEGGGLAWVGSGNITRGGWGANVELASAWTLGPAAESGGWVRPFLDHLGATLSDSLEKDLLNRVISLPWLRDAPLDPAAPVLTTHATPLAEQLRARWTARRFDSLKLLTGSTDNDAAMLRWAVETLGIRDIQICLTLDRASFDAETLGRLDAQVRLFPTDGDRPVHAKFFWLDGDDGPAVVWGSANASRAAWLLAGYNVEAVVVDDQPDPESFRAVLEVFGGESSPPEALLTNQTAEQPPPEARPEPPYRIVRATRDASWRVELEVVPSMPVGCHVDLEVGGAIVPLSWNGQHWAGELDSRVDTREAQIIRITVESVGNPKVRSALSWLSSPHELREVLAGRDFRESLGSLGRFESKQTDLRLPNEIGRIGYELLHDPAAYPDHGPRKKSKAGNGASPAPPLDPEELLTILGRHTDEGPRSPTGHVSGHTISGVFRALFSRLDADDDDAEVMDEGEDDDGNNQDHENPKQPESGSQETGGKLIDAEESARRRLRSHMERFFGAFEDDEFAAGCTATQLTQATCYPIAVALMGRRRNWCTAEEAREWTRRASRGLLQDDPYHHRVAMFTRVRDRYETNDEFDVFTRAVGDGQLWLILMVATDTLLGNAPKDALQKLTLFRELLTRPELLEAADVVSLVGLFREYYDASAIEAARSRAERLGGAIRTLEESLREHYDLLKTAQTAEALLHEHGDLVWSPKGGWGIVEGDQHGENVRVFAAQAGTILKFKAHGWWVNVSRLSTLRGAPPHLSVEAEILMRAMAGA